MGYSVAFDLTSISLTDVYMHRLALARAKCATPIRYYGAFSFVQAFNRFPALPKNLHLTTLSWPAAAIDAFRAGRPGPHPITSVRSRFRNSRSPRPRRSHKCSPTPVSAAATSSSGRLRFIGIFAPSLSQFRQALQAFSP